NARKSWLPTSWIRASCPADTSSSHLDVVRTTTGPLLSLPSMRNRERNTATTWLDFFRKASGAFRRMRMRLPERRAPGDRIAFPLRVRGDGRKWIWDRRKKQSCRTAQGSSFAGMAENDSNQIRSARSPPKESMQATGESAKLGGDPAANPNRELA